MKNLYLRPLILIGGILCLFLTIFADSPLLYAILIVLGVGLVTGYFSTRSWYP